MRPRRDGRDPNGNHMGFNGRPWGDLDDDGIEVPSEHGEWSRIQRVKRRRNDSKHPSLPRVRRRGHGTECLWYMCAIYSWEGHSSCALVIARLVTRNARPPRATGHSQVICPTRVNRTFISPWNVFLENLSICHSLHLGCVALYTRRIG